MKGIKPALLFSTIVLVTQVHAVPKAPGFAHAPYHIYPSANMSVPSGLSPATVSAAYGFNQISQQGKGQVIAIVDAYDDPNIEADLGVFNTMYNLPTCTTANGCFEKVYAQGKKPPSNASWSVEISLDVEWAHAMAPEAKIMLVEAASDNFNDLLEAVGVAVKNGANVVSMSWGGAEFSDEAQFDDLFNVKDVIFTAAAGDTGDEKIYPAASPYVISVGGTSLTTSSTGDYVSETAWSGSGGGLSAYEAEPANQSSLPVPQNPNSKRAIPDVSYNADPEHGFAVYDSVSLKNQSGWFIVGGTSAGAPQWAALSAIFNQAAGTPLNLGTILYTIAKSANYDANYNDVVTGSNGHCGYYCEARKGYDYVTGLGSPKVSALVASVTQQYRN